MLKFTGPQAYLQIPAMVAALALVIEGLVTFTPAGPFFQLIPIFVSAFAAYYAWIDGYYLVACLYVTGGLLSILAFASFRLLVNIPAIGIFVIIVTLAVPGEGPKNGIFSIMQFPWPLIQLCVVAALITAVLGYRFVYPQFFLISLIVLAVSLAVTSSIMLSGFESKTLERVFGFGLSVGTLLAGGIYYKRSLDRVTLDKYRAPKKTVTEEDKEQIKIETRDYILALEEIRKESRYRPSWLYCTCRESGILTEYQELLAEGAIEAEPESASRDYKISHHPIAGEGLKGSPYEILGVEPVCTIDEVKAGYKEQMKHYQQARIDTLSPEMQKVATKMAKAIGNAYRAITKG